MRVIKGRKRKKENTEKFRNQYVVRLSSSRGNGSSAVKDAGSK